MIQKLSLYWHNNAWCFDDEEKGIKTEPFVLGSSEIISSLAQKNNVNFESSKLILEFSNVYFKGSMIKLNWVKYQHEKWNLYRSEDLKMEGWLCPVLYSYFIEAPKILYINIY